MPTTTDPPATGWLAGRWEDGDPGEKIATVGNFYARIRRSEYGWHPGAFFWKPCFLWGLVRSSEDAAESACEDAFTRYRELIRAEACALGLLEGDERSAVAPTSDGFNSPFPE